MVEKNKNNPQKWAITLFAIGVFMAALDNGIISAALTTINKDFGVDPNWGAWGITIYTLGLAISLPIVGKLSDRYGRKKLFIVEIIIFGVGSLLVALSPTFEFYLFSRLLQALGGGGIFIIGSSHILSTMPQKDQGKYLGLLGGMNGIASVIGPNIGSFLIKLTGSWHVLFLINVPIAIGLVILGFLKLQDSKDVKPGRLDLLGTILLSGAILSIMYGLTNIDIEFFESIKRINVWSFLLTGFALLAALIVYESKLENNPNGDPIVSIKLIKQPRFLLVLFIGSLSGALLTGMIYIPAFTEQVLGIAAENSGYWMTPLALAAGIGAGLGGVFVDKRGPIFAVILSGVIAAAGYFLFPLWVDGKLTFLIASAIAGVGIGIVLGAPLNILSTEGLTSDKGSAVATLSLSRQVGMTLAPTIFAGFLARAMNDISSIFKSDFPNILQRNIENANLTPQALAEVEQISKQITNSTSLSQVDMTSVVHSIKDPSLKEVVQTSITEVTTIASQNGFDGMYMTAGILSVVVIVLAIVLQRLRKDVTQEAD